MPPTSFHWSRYRRRAATGLVAAVVAGLAVAGTAAPAAAVGTPSLIGASAVDAVAQQSADPAAQPRTHAGTARLPLVAADGDAASKVRPAGPDAANGFYCTGSLDYNIHGVEQDDYLEERVDVDYSAEVDCNFFVNRIQGAAGVFDRSEDFNGQSFDDAVIGVGTQIDLVEAYTGSSSGSYRQYVRQYDGGRRIEPAFELILLAPEGLNWGGCDLIPGLRYLVCEGLGTRELHVILGTGPVSTGLTKACRVLTAPVDPEQDRVRQLSGSTPASTQLLARVPALRQKVIDFKKDLCAVSSAGGGSTLAGTGGLELWQTAVAQAQAGTAAGDDRPLYWARLSLTRALSQWRPSFAVDRAALQLAVEKPSRGMTTDSFSGGGKKMFVSGFDPFDLGRSILTSNPSGAAALALDGKVVGGAQVQTVMFPVRYDDFDAGLVEQVFGPHLAPGSQRADFVATTSQNGSDPTFDLEFYNGRSRGPGTDNRDRVVAGPQEPGGLGAGAAQFVPTTLPVDRMAAVTGTFPIVVDTSVQERVNGVPGDRPDGPTRGSTALDGGGGSFLSNEIAYRVTRLRDELAATAIPAGHVHVPGPPLPAAGRRPSAAASSASSPPSSPPASAARRSRQCRWSRTGAPTGSGRPRSTPSSAPRPSR